MRNMKSAALETNTQRERNPNKNNLQEEFITKQVEI